MMGGGGYHHSRIVLCDFIWDVIISGHENVEREKKKSVTEGMGVWCVQTAHFLYSEN